MAMRLAFSTLGCPSWTIEQVGEGARRSGYEGEQVRGRRRTCAEGSRNGDVNGSVHMCRTDGRYLTYRVDSEAGGGSCSEVDHGPWVGEVI